MTFGPDFASKLQTLFPPKTGAQGSVLFIGPGFTEKESAPKLPAIWKALSFSPKLTGPQATPRALLMLLPTVLQNDKPEVVFISGDPAPGRKATGTEAEDWEDIARLCIRFGALPVMIPHANETKDDQFDRIVQGFRKAADVNTFVMVSPTPAEMLPKRVVVMLRLLDTHVFLRTRMDDPNKAGGPGKVIDE